MELDTHKVVPSDSRREGFLIDARRYGEVGHIGPIAVHEIEIRILINPLEQGMTRDGYSTPTHVRDFTGLCEASDRDRYNT
jgi:hypothetical protein